MKCPACAIELKMAERTGIEIDYCPQCRGVWLDRGELDKIIERSAPLQAPPTYQGRSHQEREYKKKKHKSFLGELFDF
jgi:Zn-finger nucleic acid-binding protein